MVTPSAINESHLRRRIMPVDRPQFLSSVDSEDFVGVQRLERAYFPALSAQDADDVREVILGLRVGVSDLRRVLQTMRVC